MKNSNSYQSLNRRSKGLIFFAIFFVLAFSCERIFSQEEINWKVNSISVGSGETPLSSGLAASAVLSKGKSTIFCDYNSTLGEALYFYSPIEQFSFGYSGGVFKSNMWVFWSGPIASLNLFNGHFTTLHWAGWSLGNPEMSTTEAEVKFCFSYHQFNLNLKPVQFYYALLHYQKNEPEHIFGLKADLNLSEKISLSGGLGYMLNAEKYLWSTGFSYNL